MQIDVLSLFPEMFEGPMNTSIIGKAQEKGVANIDVTDFRKFAVNKHGHVDDYPYGAGAGMLLRADPINAALEAIEGKHADTKRVILMDQLVKLYAKHAESFAEDDHLIFICGHYEGYDERIRSYVPMKFRLETMYLLVANWGLWLWLTLLSARDAVGNEESITGDSFSTGLLEYHNILAQLNTKEWLCRMCWCLVTMLRFWLEGKESPAGPERRPDMLKITH